MFKEMKVCECDICGQLKAPDILCKEDGSWIEILPTGWNNFHGTNVFLCDVCNKAFTELQNKYRKKETKNV